MTDAARAMAPGCSHIPAERRMELSEQERARLSRRARLLAGATVGYNVVEAVVAVTAGAVAGSTALVAFGLDSVVEVSSGLIVLWQFSHRVPESRERQATRLMAVAFFGLAAYVGVESVRALLGGEAPDASPVGMVLAALSLLVMPFLSAAQRRTGRRLASTSVVADSKQTLLCTYLSAVLLLGLVVNAWWGWWWADAAAGLVIAAVAAREGIQALRGDACCAAPVIDAPYDARTLTVTDDALAGSTARANAEGRLPVGAVLSESDGCCATSKACPTASHGALTLNASAAGER